MFIFLIAMCIRGIADKYMGSVPEEHLTSTWTHMMTFTYGGQNIQATLPLYLGPDETDSSSVKLLVSLLGQVQHTTFWIFESSYSWIYGINEFRCLYVGVIIEALLTEHTELK